MDFNVGTSRSAKAQRTRLSPSFARRRIMSDDTSLSLGDKTRDARDIGIFQKYNTTISLRLEPHRNRIYKGGLRDVMYP